MKAFRAKDEIRTRDPDLGKVVLYQLSYSRIRMFVASLWMRIIRIFDTASSIFAKKIQKNAFFLNLTVFTGFYWEIAFLIVYSRMNFSLSSHSY